MLRGRPAEQNASENALHFKLNAWSLHETENAKRSAYYVVSGKLAGVILAHNTTQRSINQPNIHPTSCKPLKGVLLINTEWQRRQPLFFCRLCNSHALIIALPMIVADGFEPGIERRVWIVQEDMEGMRCPQRGLRLSLWHVCVQDACNSLEFFRSRIRSGALKLCFLDESWILPL